MKHSIILFFLILFFSCNKTDQTKVTDSDSESKSGLIVFFSADIVENSKLNISINGLTIFDKHFKYNESNI